jgi:hypothetical protein
MKATFRGIRGAWFTSITVASLFAAPLVAQQPMGGRRSAAAASFTLKGALTADVDDLSQKFTGLARVMAGKYDWRPMEGVRSVDDVFNLIVTENRMLEGVLSGTPGGGAGGMGQGRQGGMGRQGQSGGARPPQAAITDPAQLQEALRTSYATLKQTITGMSESDLNAPVRLFGRETTKSGAILMLMLDQHEHLGQSIAYARTNRVTPPWSQTQAPR